MSPLQTLVIAASYYDIFATIWFIVLGFAYNGFVDSELDFRRVLDPGRLHVSLWLFLPVLLPWALWARRRDRLSFVLPGNGTAHVRFADISDWDDGVTQQDACHQNCNRRCR